MPRSARLTNIASGLCGAFASRNNDLDGYWSIGKLRSLADQHGQSTVSLDVLALSMQPLVSGFEPVLVRHQLLLAKLADMSGIRFQDISAAEIVLAFAPPPRPRASCHAPDCGDPFELTVRVEADGRAAGIVRHAGYCRPHDPAQETRSTRPPAY